MNLTWQEQDDPIFGHAFWLRGLREGESATVRGRGAGTFVAIAWIGGRFMSHNARTMKSAMTRLEREIDKRSLGLFGVDDLTFTTEHVS